MTDDIDDLDSEDSAPGWEAIDAALLPLYGTQKPLHWVAKLPAGLGGEDPLQGISAYRREEPRPHWHFVTYGFSELFQKISEDQEVSGYGFELTFRLAIEEGVQEPPSWVYHFLQNLARYVFKTGNVFGARDQMPLNGPIAIGDPTKIHAMVCILDPELSPIVSQNGSVEFVQIVGITNNEFTAIRQWQADAFLALLQHEIPLGITDLRRTSLLKNPAVLEAVRTGIARDGSETDFIPGTHVTWQANNGYTLSFGARLIPELQTILLSRLRFKRSLTFSGQEQVIEFQAGSEFSASADKNKLTVTLTVEEAEDLAAAVEPLHGIYLIDKLPGLQIEVVVSEIKNSKGEVIDRIG